ncbi:MAG: hypothetical protein HYR91_06830 [Flavobacteriia bacterium]|nr:hypothetical protein [Flavobacteriia bacterium]
MFLKNKIVRTFVWLNFIVFSVFGCIFLFRDETDRLFYHMQLNKSEIKAKHNNNLLTVYYKVIPEEVMKMDLDLKKIYGQNKKFTQIHVGDLLSKKSGSYHLLIMRKNQFILELNK